MPECEYYDWYMVAYMHTSNGIDLAYYTNVYLNYSVWYETEDYYDYIAILYSADGDNWDMIDFLCGISGGWVDYSFPVGQLDYVYVSFVFYSFDASTTEEGVYLDDISITGDPLPKPNLTYGTPGGWSGPIVPSSVQGTHTANTLYTNQPTYIDFAVRNTQSSTTETFFTDLYIDEIWIDWFYTYGIDSDAWSLVEDVSYTVSTPGEHTLRIEIDPYDWVEEENELDNIFIDTFNWINSQNLPNLTYTTPAGWSGPIVPSDEQGTNYVSQLYANQPTYIDWAIKNTGTASAGPFFTRLLIDDVSVQSWYISGLAQGATETREDFQYTLDVGYHTLRLEIDYYYDVAESNENDNTYSQAFYWNLAEITAEGEVWFRQLPHMNWYLATDFKVELWDYDGPDSGQILDSGYTDIFGEFTIGPVSNVEEDGTRQDIYVRVYSENDAAVVGDNITPQYIVIPFYFTSDTVENVANGLYRWKPPYNPSIDADTVESGFFYIAHVVRESYNNWLTLRLNDDPGQTQVLLMKYSPWGSAYAPSIDLLVIEAADSADTWFPDTFDKDVILHEFGHKIHFSLGFFDAAPTGPPQHSITTIYSPEFAVREAFGDFWSAVSRNDSIHRNSFNSFLDTSWANYENVEWGQEGYSVDTVVGTANTLGKANEGAVAGILWDIYDDVDDDYSGNIDWGDTTRPHHPDGIGDTLWNGIDNILIALLDRTVSGHHPDNIDEFWQAWFTYPAFGHGQAMQDIWYEHGEIMHCCNTDGIRGDVDMGGSINVGDPAYLVAYLFGTPSGPAPPCFEEADVDASGSINTGDVAYLTAYLFGIPAGPLPLPCP
jgi:hypothetical protein